jgi:16S rRNA (guanine(966)-N(2))-methyltransferase RsmD
MRITTGRYKGRQMKMPAGIRPTQDKVRKALFDILGDIQGLSFLELFAGSAAVGLEALSRGVKQAVFAEKDRQCLRVIEDNLAGIKLSDYQIIRADAQNAVKKLNTEGKKFNIIFLDPPYYKDMAKKTLQTLSSYDILSRTGFIIVQHFKKDNLPESLGDLALFRQSRYGDTILSFYRKAE